MNRRLSAQCYRPGGWEASRGVRTPSSHHQQHQQHQQQRANDPGGEPRRPTSGHWQWRSSAHDDSALYMQSKAIQQSAAMRPSKARRGESFSVVKTNAQPSPSTSDPPWSRPSSGQGRGQSGDSHGGPRSSYPDGRDRQQRTAVRADHRYSEGQGRFQPPRDHDIRGQGHDRGQDPHMVSVRSSPNLNRRDTGAGAQASSSDSSVKPVKSSSDIPDDVSREKYSRRQFAYDPHHHHHHHHHHPHPQQQMLNKPGVPHGYGGAGFSIGDDSRPRDYLGDVSKRYSEDMYTSDMKAVGEAHSSSSLTAHSLQKYQPDYENVALLGTAPLKSEKISEIEDAEDALDGDGLSVPSRVAAPPAAAVADPNSAYSPTPPQRDPSSLKYIKVNQNHEKYPSWPVTQPNAGSEQSQPINTRAQSWTDHTNTGKEFPQKQRLAYQPGLRPLPEKNSPASSSSDAKGEDGAASGKAPRNTSDPGLKTPEFCYDRYGRVVQKKKDMKGRFEDFYHNSKPGYLPPRFDSDGHSYGDKEYSAPSPPERDVVGIDHLALSQALGTDAGEPPQQQQQQPQPQAQQRPPQQQASPHEAGRPTSHYPGPMTPQQRAGPSRGAPSPALPGSAGSAQSQPSPHDKQRPGYLPMSASPHLAAARDPRRVDMATSPLASPRDALPSKSLASPSHRDYLLRDSPSSAAAAPGGGGGVGGGSGRQPASNKAFIVRHTPYYNTSTQTDVQSSYAVKMSDPHARQCNVEIQVGDVSSQTSPPFHSHASPKQQQHFEEKSIQARMSREFQPSDLDSTSPKKQLSPADKRNFFRYQFEGMQSIHAKYATDEDVSASTSRLGGGGEVFSPLASGDQASIMRKLSEEFFGSGGSKLALLGDKRHSSASSQEPSPKPIDMSSVSVHSGTMSQAESYSSVVIHPSESAGPFGRDDFGSQSSIADSRQDLRSNVPRGRNSLEYFPRSAPRPLHESKKFNSLSAISHQRESSAPVLGGLHTTQSNEYLTHAHGVKDGRWGSYRDASSTSEASTISSPPQPKAASEARLPGEPCGQSSSQHSRMESADSVFSEPSVSGHKERNSGNSANNKSPGGVDSGAGRPRERPVSADMVQVGRKPSMKKAYGIYDENDRLLSSPTKDSVRSVPPSGGDGGGRARSSYSDAKQLDQIEEEGGHGDGGVARQRLDSWRSDVDKRARRMNRLSSDQTLSSRERSRVYENPTRPQRLFDGSIDSGVGSEVSSRVDGQTTPGEQWQPSSLSSGADLKKFQQQAVLNFVQRKTGSKAPSSASSLASASVEHSPESSLYESISTPRSPHSPTTESVSDLISKTNENLAKRADSIRRSGSTSSRASSSDYMDMVGRQERSRKETEWSRLRSSGSIHYGSNRSSLCSENTYEDISVFATPRDAVTDDGKNSEGRRSDSSNHSLDDGSKMESGLMAAYQNFPGGSRRRPPPPPPRTPSPEPHTPPALPPRNYLQRRDDGESGGEEPREDRSDGGGGNGEDAKLNFRTLFSKWENNSPRENDYAAQIRRQAMKISGQRGGSGGSGSSSSSATAPSSMSLIHSRTQMAVSNSYKREPMVAQEATPPTGSGPGSGSGSSPTFSTVSSTSGVSSVPPPPRHVPGPEVVSSASAVLEGYKHSLSSSSSSPSQVKDCGPDMAAVFAVNRDTKPRPPLPSVSSPTGSKPPQLPERTVPVPLPARGEDGGGKPLPPRTDNLPPRADNLPPRGDNLPPRGDNFPPRLDSQMLARDRSSSELGKEPSERLLLAVPGDLAPRDRSSSDSRLLAPAPKAEGSSRDGSHSPVGRQADPPLPLPPKDGAGHDAGLVMDMGDLPPPPPELLNESQGDLDKEDGTFPDDSYGAYRNRSSRQVGTYKRSSSAAVIPTSHNQQLKAATDAQALFSDRRLGNQNWNSDSQLQTKTSPHQDGGASLVSSGLGGGPGGDSGPPGRPPERPGNVPAFRAESGQARTVIKVSGGPQPLSSQSHPRGQPSAAGAGDHVDSSKVFTARPYVVDQQRAGGMAGGDDARNSSGAGGSSSASSPNQPRSVREHITNLERKSSFSSSPSPASNATPTQVVNPQHPTTANSSPATSASQRWANAAPFEATHRPGGGEGVKPQQRGNNNISSSNNNNSNNVNAKRVAASTSSRPMVLTDSHHSREGSTSAGSPAFSHSPSAAMDSSTQHSVNTRPRAFSERSRQGEGPSSPFPDSHKPNQRFAEVAPLASDSRALPGHVHHPAADWPRPSSSSSPYHRRESAPMPQIPPEAAIAMVSPRRKSEGNFLDSPQEGDKDCKDSPSEDEVVVSHGRQPSQEELECDLRAKELAKEVAESEKKLSDVLSEDATRKRMKYMDGLFSGPGDPQVKTPASVRRHQSQGSWDRSWQHNSSAASSPSQPQADSSHDYTQKRNSLPKEYFVSPPKAVLEMEWRKKDETSTNLTKNIHDNEALIRQKEELIEKLYKKLDLLKEERKGLQEEIEENEALGGRVCQAVESKCQNPSEREKFHTYIEDLEKIVRLLLNLSGQLARAENAVQGLAENADPKLKSMTLDKRKRLQIRHAEAKQLKEGIDKRSDTVSAFLRQSLGNEELNDYAYFVKMKSKLTIEFQELEDKITLGLEQIQELKKSIPERSEPLSSSHPPSSTSSSSPRSSPVPSS